MPDERLPRPGRAMLLRALLAGLTIILVAAGGTATAALLVLDDEIDNFRPIETIKGIDPDTVAAGEPQTILILGSDRRKGDKAAGIPQRSDTIILARLDPDRDTAATMSIPRDLVVDVGGGRRARINTAYSAKGPAGTRSVLKRLLTPPGEDEFEIHHTLDVGFRGFREVVNELNCIYTDVDRRYFNDNNPPVGSDEKYSVIDLQPGYQRLCGEDALSFVRFRHLDSDFVRAGRQQSFLSDAKGQIGTERLFEDREELFGILAENTRSDLADASNAEILKLAKTALESSKNPARDISFPATDTKDGALEISERALRKTIETFMAAGGAEVKTNTGTGEGSKKQPAKRAKKKGAGLAPGLLRAEDEGEDHVLKLTTTMRTLPVYFPGVRVGGEGGYVTAASAPDTTFPRGYTLRDRAGNPHPAYRIVLAHGETGQYYGVQGTTWTRAPILDDPTDYVSIGDKTFSRYFDGGRIRLMAWRPKDDKRVYWVSNTLSNRLTNAQMTDIARSLTRIGE